MAEKAIQYLNTNGFNLILPPILTLYLKNKEKSYLELNENKIKESLKLVAKIDENII